MKNLFETKSHLKLDLVFVEDLYYYDRPLVQQYKRNENNFSYIAMVLEDTDDNYSLWAVFELNPKISRALIEELDFENALSLRESILLANRYFVCKSKYMDSLEKEAVFIEVALSDLQLLSIPNEGSYLKLEHYLKWKSKN